MATSPTTWFCRHETAARPEAAMREYLTWEITLVTDMATTTITAFGSSPAEGIRRRGRPQSAAKAQHGD